MEIEQLDVHCGPKFMDTKVRTPSDPGTSLKLKVTCDATDETAVPSALVSTAWVGRVTKCA